MNKILTFFLFFSVIALYNCTSTESGTADTKPNIIYILADDLGYGEIGAYGQTKIETPNIDALASNGMIFTQHYTGAPVCAPARAVLLTGQHLGHSYVRGNDEWGERGNVWSYEAMVKDSTLEGQRPLPEETVTIAKQLKSAGYRTGIFGKWGLGAPHTESIPTKMGFDYFFGYNCQRIAHTFNPIHMYENERRYIINKDTIAPNTGLDPGSDPYDPASYAKYQQAGYSPEVSFEKMMGFVKENGNDPFFLYWASPIPHVPLQAPKDWVDHYVEKFGDEEPYYFFEGGKKKSYFPVRYPHATYAAMISYLDENIGKLVDYLKEKDLFDNTLIVFTSDNGPTFTGGADSPWFDSGGPFASEYGRGKGFLYEGGIRIPMIATWVDQIKPGSKTEHISAFWDVMPTLCEIAGAETPKNTDGISFLNTMTQEGEQKEHEYMYWEYPEYGGQVAVRMGKWKILWKDLKKGNKEVEVYNLDEDLQELNNIADEHPELVEKLYKIIKKEHQTPEIERFRMEALEEVYLAK